MCLAIPARIKSINENQMAEVDIMGVKRHVSLDLVPGAKLEDYVLVHAGFAIQIVDEEAAAESLRLFDELGILEPETEA